MMTKWMAKGYLWLLLVLLYSPILIIMIFSFTEAKVLGNWTGFSTKLYSSLFTGGVQRSLVSALWNTFAIAMIAATVSTLLGSIAAIGIFNLRSRTRQVMNFANAIPMMNADPAYMLDLGTETSFCYSDASHFRISNIRLSYRFPQAWMEMLHLQSAALSFSCDNVHTFTSSRFIGNDPENVAGWAAPRRFIFGLNVTF